MKVYADAILQPHQKMETSNMRRKKRKTRRCLDELRKRTHQSNDACNTSNKNTIGLKKSSCCLITSNCITDNRLTLLNKSVKSETVTRLQLTDLKNKKLKKLNKENTESGFNKNLISHEEKKYDVNTILGKHSDTIAEDINEIEAVSPDLQIHEEGNHESPISIILFSPVIHQDNVATNTNHNNSIEISILSSLSSSSSNLNTNFKSIESDNLMDALECYMKQIFPKMTCDCVEKWRADLLNIYIKNQKTGAQEYNIRSDADLTNNKEPSQENIIQNPKDYLGYSWKYLPCTITSEVDVASPTSSNSSDSICIPSCSPILTAVYDTPEYSYYPHRLN